MRELPHEKALVERLADEPFTFLGINCDPVDVYREKATKAKLPWRNVLDGGSEGPIATRWNISGWPTTLVIDPKGVVRFRNVRGDKLEQAVA